VRERERELKSQLTFSSSTETSVEEVVTTSVGRTELGFSDERDRRVLKVVPEETNESVFENVSDFRIFGKRVEQDDDLSIIHAREGSVSVMSDSVGRSE
jgi:hypothetical protein